MVWKGGVGRNLARKARLIFLDSQIEKTKMDIFWLSILEISIPNMGKGCRAFRAPRECRGRLGGTKAARRHYMTPLKMV